GYKPVGGSRWGFINDASNPAATLRDQGDRSGYFCRHGSRTLNCGPARVLRPGAPSDSRGSDDSVEGGMNERRQETEDRRQKTEDRRKKEEGRRKKERRKDGPKP